jgi:hypothetical protein
LEIEFVAYDDLFAAESISAGDIAEAILKLSASGVVNATGDFLGGLFGRPRGFGDVTEVLRWTAGMVVQWAENDALRAAARQRVLNHVQKFKPDVVLAHSLGSLLSYDTFLRPENQQAIAARTFVSLGSQIGNPFVRGTVAFNGRIEPLAKAEHWYHLFNVHDNAFTARIRLHADNFTQVETGFDDPGILDHDAISYLTHPNTVSTVWRTLARTDGELVRAFAAKPKQLNAMNKAFSVAAARGRPHRRALLVGINEYPDPENRLEGCLNDVFLMSSVLQECGFEAEDIRVVLNERATAAGILERLEWLLDGAQDGQQRVFFYSGHGAQIPGYGVGEVVDHDDECLVPFDFDWKREHAVTDDHFYELYSQLPYGTRFLTVFDCCHSGGMTREGSLRARGLTPPDDIRHRMLRWSPEHEMWVPRTFKETKKRIEKETNERFFGKSGVTHRLGYASRLRSLIGKDFDQACKALGHHGPFMPVILKACQEDEFSYEYRHGVTSFGAFTYSLAKVFRKRRTGMPTWNTLIGEVAVELDALGYRQKPGADGPGSVLRSKVPWQASRSGAKR